jgi:hypothetical protein
MSKRQKNWRLLNRQFSYIASDAEHPHTLEAEGMAYFGGGIDETSAWAPRVTVVKDQKIAFVGCTTIKQPTPATTNYALYMASDVRRKGGAALCGELRYQIR